MQGENVLIDRDGHVYLADFGVTATMEVEQSLTRTASRFQLQDFQQVMAAAVLC